MMFCRTKTQSSQAGFSLVELMVSMTLFVTVLTISTGTLLTLVDANLKVQRTKLAMSNMTFVLDSMTREIRTGTEWFCGRTVDDGSDPDIPGRRGSHAETFFHPSQDAVYPNSVNDCNNSGLSYSDPYRARFFSFVEGGGSLTGGLTGANSNRITYYHDTETNRIFRILGGDRTEGAAISPADIQIDALLFIVSDTKVYRPSQGSAGDDTVQPSVTIHVSGRTLSNGTYVPENDTTFTIQTTVGQRSLDV